MTKMMNKNKERRPTNFEKMLRDFMKESDANQKEIMRRNNQNASAKRKKPNKLSAH